MKKVNDRAQAVNKRLADKLKERMKAYEVDVVKLSYKTNVPIQSIYHILGGRNVNAKYIDACFNFFHEQLTVSDLPEKEEQQNIFSDDE